MTSTEYTQHIVFSPPQYVEEKGLPNGYVPLDSTGHIPESYIPQSVKGGHQVQGNFDPSKYTLGTDVFVGDENPIFYDDDVYRVPSEFNVGSSGNDVPRVGMYWIANAAATYPRSIGGQADVEEGDWILIREVIEGTGADAGKYKLVLTQMNGIAQVTSIGTGANKVQGAVEFLNENHVSFGAGSMDAEFLAPGTVQSGALAAGSVLSDNLANAAVGQAAIAGDAVTGFHIAVGAVGPSELATAAVEADSIAAHAVTTLALADDSVTDAKLVDGAVGTFQLANNAVTTDKILDGAVGTDELGAEVVTAAKLQAGAVTAPKLATSSVTSGKIDTGAVVTDKIANDAVDGDKLAPNAVEESHVMDGAIVTSKLGSASVLGSKIAPQTIEFTNIANDTLLPSNVAPRDRYVYESVSFTNAMVLHEPVTSGQVKFSTEYDTAAHKNFYRLARGTAVGEIVARVHVHVTMPHNFSNFYNGFGPQFQVGVMTKTASSSDTDGSVYVTEVFGHQSTISALDIPARVNSTLDSTNFSYTSVTTSTQPTVMAGESMLITFEMTLPAGCNEVVDLYGLRVPIQTRF